MPKREDDMTKATTTTRTTTMEKNVYSEVFNFDSAGSESRDAELFGSVRPLNGQLNNNNNKSHSRVKDYVNLDANFKKTTNNEINFNLSKNLILNKFFRSTEKNFAAYENLCTGCGYGVFEARGRLCNFCQLIVNGGYLGSTSPSTPREETGNIYENICEKCSAIYGGEECSVCSIATTPTSTTTATTYDELDNNIPLQTATTTKTTIASNKLPLTKANNKKRLFYGLIGSLKRAKTIGSTAGSNSSGSSSNERLKCCSSPLPQQLPSTTRSSPHVNRLEIIHNVDGYENVFRTNETFDLNRICELKQHLKLTKISTSTASDRHIYGRLRNDQLKATADSGVSRGNYKESSSCNSIVAATATATATATTSSSLASFYQSDDQLTSGVSSNVDNLFASSINSSCVVGKNSQSDPNLLKITSNSNNNFTFLNVTKRNTIGRFILTRSKSKEKNSKQRKDFAPIIPPKQSLYLPDSVCQWMTSLRSETHRYRCFGAPDDVTFCDPKSIPPKNSYCQWSRSVDNLSGIVLTSSAVANYIECNSNGVHHKTKSGVTLLSLTCTAAEEKQNEHEGGLPCKAIAPQPPPVDHFAEQMVNEFKRSLMEKQHYQQQQQDEDEEMFCTLRNPSAELRSKRQAIYLKLDETPPLPVILSAAADDNYKTRDQLATTTVRENNIATAAAAAAGVNSDRSTAHCGSRFSLVEQTTSSSSGGGAGGASPINTNRRGICEKDSEFVTDILSAFDSFLRRESCELSSINGNSANTDCVAVNVNQPLLQGSSVVMQCQSDRQQLNSKQLIDHDDDEIVKRSTTKTSTATTASQFCFDIEQLIYGLVLSRSLNKIVLTYDTHLKVFIRRTVDDRECSSIYIEWDFLRLIKKFKRFVEFCRISRSRSDCCGDLSQVFPNLNSNPLTQVSIESVVLFSDCDTNENRGNVVVVDRNKYFNLDLSTAASSCLSMTVVVPTTITATSERKETTTTTTAKVETLNNMTSLSSTINKNNNNSNNNSNKLKKDEESIYQPIWKFKTVGVVQERYQTDADYFDIATTSEENDRNAKSVIGCESSSFDVEDHGEWETDDEFMFTTTTTTTTTTATAKTKTIARTTKLDEGQNTNISNRHLDDADNISDSISMKSNNSSNNVKSSSLSHSGSTITGYASSSASSSTMTIASVASLRHPIFRNICIFYSLSDPKMRAILYDYDRIQCSLHFSSRMSSQTSLASASGCGATPEDGDKKSRGTPNSFKIRDSRLIPTTPPVKQRPRCRSPTARNYESFHQGSESDGSSRSTFCQSYSLADSVQAWKFMLLDVNYVEDEEDMIVSENEILRAQEIKEEEIKPQVNILQRFKSISSGNLLDIPAEEDKKSIAERMRNKLQRGVFKLNVRSPKGEKKSRGIFRRTEATSLYLEDGVKPKYPIFGASLEQLELNHTSHPNVPRFVVDCIEYIERKDCIQMDGLYRASGNKVSIDELKQKLSESYIYDPKLLITDDIHTLTSLLKMFFRELATPLIPQETYLKVGRNLMDKTTIELMKNVFKEMRNPNRSTLKFLIKHLTTVAHYSSENRMPASNLAIVWGPCILSANQIEYDIARMNTLAKVLIENYDRIFGENERLVS